jgi:hypothetical protein
MAESKESTGGGVNRDVVGLVAAAILPAVGLVCEQLRQFWSFVMLASIVLMAYAGAKISTREQVLKH